MMKKLYKLLCTVIVCSVFLFSGMAIFAEEISNDVSAEPPESIAGIDIAELFGSIELPVINTYTNDSYNSEETSSGAESNSVGNGNLIEDVSDEEINRQFITVASKNGNIFYIIIDKTEKSENVYFLNAVDEYDLFAFAEDFPEEVLQELEIKSAGEAASETNSDGSPAEVTIDETETPTEPEITQENNNKNIMIMSIIAVLGIGGAVYFKVIKPKSGGGNHHRNNANDDDDDEDEEEINEDTADEQEDD